MFVKPQQRLMSHANKLINLQPILYCWQCRMCEGHAIDQHLTKICIWPVGLLYLFADWEINN